MTKYDWTESGYAHHLVDRIFRILFPRAGFSLRPAQLQLAHTMLAAMLHQNILLCDAGTGTGKTYAYLAAAIAASLEQAKEQLAFQPILISTSSIALQHAILQDYLPTLSQLLLSNALIDHPLHGVIRKGKAHYVCDARLERRLRCVPKRKNPKALAALRQLKQQLDMDSLPHLSAYDRRQVAIPPDCPCSRTDCRYLRFLNRCQSQDYLFHICNHNLLLADAMRRQTGKKPILPERRIVILDEAHKLPEAARQMLGITLGWKQISDFIHSLRVEHYLLAAERLEETARPVIRLLTSDGSRELSQCWDHLLELERLLGRIELQLFPLLTSETKRQLSALQAQFTLLCGQGPLRCYLIQEDSGDYLLCSHESSRGEQLNELLWKQMRSAVLTSGTLAVGKSFQCYQGETGLTGHPFLRTSIAPSPFAYQTHCLLYLPQQPPEFSGEQEQSYYDQLAVEMARLIRSAHGHTLILFTSYAAITESKRRWRRRPGAIPSLPCLQ